MIVSALRLHACLCNSGTASAPAHPAQNRSVFLRRSFSLITLVRRFPDPQRISSTNGSLTSISASAV
jgi:hypothetical protein